MKTILAAIAVWLLASSLAIAQDTRVAVSVNHRGNDQVGQQVAAALKQAIHGSKSFRFVYDEVAPSFPRIVAYLVTINVDKDTGASAISTTLSYDSFDIRGRGIYLTSLVQYCTRLSVETYAKGILPYLDATVESLRRTWPDLWRTLIPGGEYADLQVPDTLSDDGSPVSSLPAASR
ncbi:MAG TPA: hypothetical protein VK208_09070 [Pyrinomonadaceae bacterium]|nr:hypothetical protein [Pyrinomonadaceae bacterium]